MKRLLPIFIVGAAALVLGGIAFGVLLWYFMSDGGWIGKPRPPADKPPPFSLEQMQDLHDNPDKASKEVGKIIACFENGDEDLRVLAAVTLGQVGPKAVGPLREKLTDQNEEVRYGCVQSLALLKSDAAPAVPDLLKCLHDTNPRVRYKSAYALGQTGVKSDAIFEGLLGTLDDLDDRVPETSLKVLEELGAPPKATLPKLAKRAAKDSPPATRAVALKLLGQMGPEVVPTFQILLKEANTLDQIEVIKAIAQLGPNAAPLLPDLEAIMIKNRFWDAQEDLIATFKKCGKDGANGLGNVLRKLAPELNANDERGQIVLKAIGDIGPDAKGTVPLLIELLKDREALRLPTLDALGGIGPAASEAIPIVESLVKNPKNKNDPAVIALRRMGKIAGSGKTSLLDKSNDQTVFTSNQLAKVPGANTALEYKDLEELSANPDKAAREIDRIIACFEKGDEDLRLLASETLKGVGVKAVPPLRARLTDKNANVRFWCVQSLAVIGKDAAPALDDVLARVKDEDANVRYKAIYALGKFGVKSDAVFAALISALDDKDVGVLETTFETLDKLGPPKAAVPALARLATRNNDPISLAALTLLAKTGEPAVPTFRELLKKRNVKERPQVFAAMVPLGANAKQLVPDLLDIVLMQIQGGGGFIDRNLLVVLKQCGPEAAKGMADIVRRINRDSIAFIARESLLKAIGEMRAEAEVKETVPILIELLKENTPTHPVVEYRYLILDALGAIGPAARDAIPIVESLRNPEFKGLTVAQQIACQQVADAAAVALRRMGRMEKE